MTSNSNIRLIIKDTSKYGNGVFADQDIEEGEVIYILSGEIITFEESIKRIREGKEAQTDSLQVGLEMDMDLDEFSRSFNHSCDPNAGIRKVSELFALRDIRKGEEITQDYSATIGPNIPDSLWSMKCVCGSSNCRNVLKNIFSIPKEQLDFYRKIGALQYYMIDELNSIELNGGKLPKYKEIII